MRCHALILAALLAVGISPAPSALASETPVSNPVVALDESADFARPEPRDDYIPSARWDFHPEGSLWTRTTLAALKGHGEPLINMVPRDIGDWCPSYATNDEDKRAAFWNGFLSALAKHESTWKPRAVGGGGRWYGLTQILPGTARGYKCRAGTGERLKNGSENLSCAVRIMATTVPRDNAVARKANGRLGGVAADWGPLTKSGKRKEMAAWLRSQNYCKLLNTTRPSQRPTEFVQAKNHIPKPRPTVASD